MSKTKLIYIVLQCVLIIITAFYLYRYLSSIGGPNVDISQKEIQLISTINSNFNCSTKISYDIQNENLFQIDLTFEGDNGRKICALNHEQVDSIISAVYEIAQNEISNNYNFDSVNIYMESSYYDSARENYPHCSHGKTLNFRTK